MSFVRITSSMKADMLRNGGFRERDIVGNAKYAVSMVNNRYVKVFRKPTRSGEVKTGIFDLKTHRWRG